MEHIQELTQEQRKYVEAIKIGEKTIEDLRAQIEVNHHKLSTLAPHKIGEIVDITSKRQYKRAVLCEIKTQVYADMLFYNYEFRPLKVNGCLCQNKIYLLKEEYEWTGEQYSE